MITLPWFAKELSPNVKVHWAKRGIAAKAARKHAFLATRLAGYAKVPDEHANSPKTLSIVFYHRLNAVILIIFLYPKKTQSMALLMLLA